MMKQRLKTFIPEGGTANIGSVMYMNNRYYMRVKTNNDRVLWCSINEGQSLFTILKTREANKIAIDDIVVTFEYRDTPMGPVDYFGYYTLTDGPREPKEEQKVVSTWNYSLNPNYGIF